MFYNFCANANLKAHKLIHTGPLIICHRNIIKIGEKSYKCDKCSSTFAHKCSLNKHTRCHSGFFKIIQYYALNIRRKTI